MLKDPVQKEKKESSVRVYRGGSWSVNADYLVVSFRGGYPPGNRVSYFGLRPVRNAAPEEKK
mgnify:CR=1 FL=1